MCDVNLRRTYSVNVQSLIRAISMSSWHFSLFNFGYDWMQQRVQDCAVVVHTIIIMWQMLKYDYKCVIPSSFLWHTFENRTRLKSRLISLKHDVYIQKHMTVLKSDFKFYLRVISGPLCIINVNHKFIHQIRQWKNVVRFQNHDPFDETNENCQMSILKIYVSTWRRLRYCCY